MSAPARPEARLARAAGVGLLACALGAPGPAAAAIVHVATISGPIDPAVADYVERAVEQCADEGGTALVIELDTPGGLVASTEDIVKAILNAPVPVVVYVSPRGASAASAGTFITMAGHVAAMAPGTNIGAARAVSMFQAPPQPPQPGEEGETPQPARDPVGEKIENWLVAFSESIAELRDRNVEFAAEAVRNAEAITQKEALEKGVVDLVAEDLDHLLELIHGREVTIERESVRIETLDARIARIEMGLVNRVFSLIAHPQIVLLLMLGGLAGLYVEISNPGLIVPGAVGVVCLLLAGLSLQIIPFNSLGLILILVGVGLMAAEIFVTSFGALFAGGVACLALGGYLLFDVPELGDVRVPFLTVVLPAVSGFAVLGAIIVFGVSRSFLRPQFAGSEGMVGDTAVADTDLNPTGRVFLHGEYWNAEADRPVSKGERVRIVEIRELGLRVARAEPG